MDPNHLPNFTLPQGGSNPRSVVRGGAFLVIPRRSIRRNALPEKLAKRSFFDTPNFVGRVQLISICKVYSVRTGRFDQLQCDLTEVSLASVVEVVLLC